MNVEIIGHPFDHERDLHSTLQQLLPEATAFWALVAWAQTAGLQLIESELRGLRARDIPSQLFVGIDGGIATREALGLCLDLFAEVRVVHDVGRRTFHPKVYCIETPDVVYALVGSSNLTGGGFGRNFELNVLLRMDASDPGDLGAYHQLETYRDRLVADGMPCRHLTRDLLGELAREGLISETSSQRHREQEARTERTRRAATRLFGNGLPYDASSVERPGAAGPGARARAERPAATHPDVALRDGVPLAAPPLRAGALLEATWSKTLSRSDVGRKAKKGGGHNRKDIVLPKGSSPGRDVDYLRHVFFDRLEWRTEPVRGRLREYAPVVFDVVIDGAPRGAYEMRITHDMFRTQDTEAEGRKRGNSPTYLHPRQLADLLREADYTGATLRLDKLPAGYRLTIQRSAPDHGATVPTQGATSAPDTARRRRLRSRKSR